MGFLKEPTCQRRIHGFDAWVQEEPLEKEMATSSGSCLRDPMDRGACWATVHGVAEVTHDLAIKQQQIVE